jgi:hypothetical protein
MTTSPVLKSNVAGGWGSFPSVPGAGFRSRYRIATRVVGNTANNDAGSAPAFSVPCGVPAGTNAMDPGATSRRESPIVTVAAPLR